MKVEMLTLDALHEAAREVEKQQFVEQYVGFFLVALGTLSAEEIQQGKQARVPGLEPDTVAFSFDGAFDVSQKDYPLRGQVFFLRSGPEADELLVGSSPTCEITVDDSSVSEIHCVIRVGSADLGVTDAQSTNGTLVNLVQLSPQTEKMLNDEDVVSIGRCCFQVFSATAFYDHLI